MAPPLWWPPGLPWPEANTGLGGPDDRNLTDLYNQMLISNGHLLNAVNKLNEIGLSISNVDTNLARLTGTAEQYPATWTGLADYLWRTVGEPQPNVVFTVRDQINFVLGELFKLNTQIGEGFSPDLNAQNTLGQLVENALAISGFTSNTATSAAAISLVLGLIEADPTGSTIKDLLRSSDANLLALKICCEEGQVTEPPANTENPEPLEVSCDAEDYPYMRNTGWVSISPPLLDNQPGMEGWAPLFSGANSHFDGDLQQDPPAGGSGILFPAFVNVNTGYDACMKWDFTDNVVPQLANFYRFGSGDFYNGGETPSSISPLNVPIGGFIQSLSAGIRWIPVFYTAEGAGPPGNNLWLTVLFGPA